MSLPSLRAVLVAPLIWLIRLIAVSRIAFGSPLRRSG